VSRSSLRDERSMAGSGYRYLQEGLVAFGNGIADLADEDERIVAGSADLIVSTLFIEFALRHPKRIFQFGIAERNMISAAAGLASTGLRPYVSTFGAFASLMCLEQIRTDLAYPNMPVRVVGTHSGLALGYLSTSHHSTEDLSALRGISNLTIVSPPDGATAAALARSMVDWPTPIYFRLGRGRDEGLYDEIPAEYEPGVPHTVRSGSDLILVATGIMVKRAATAAELLAADGISATVLDVHTIKPFAGDLVAELVSHHSAIVTIEEHNIEGGLGTLVSEALFARDVHRPLYKHGLRDEFAVNGPPNHVYRYYGLDAVGITTVAKRLLATTTSRGNLPPSEALWTSDDKSLILKEYDLAKG